ncbi:YdcF family protein [Bifidobacterium callimiconis]
MLHYALYNRHRLCDAESLSQLQGGIMHRTETETMTAARLDELAQAINTVGEFCGPRDVSTLTQATVSAQLAKLMTATENTDQADALVLFGGSILHGVDVLAQGIRNGVAKHYVIVGGAGHTTQTLRDIAGQAFPSISTDGKTEAQIFAECLRERHGLSVDWLETKSTNCGNNITNLLDLLRGHLPDCRSLILCQDATMQLRMTAGLRKFAPDMTVINYAAYRTRVAPVEYTADRFPNDPATMLDHLTYIDEPEGMWPIDRYVSLLMGEIARLTDDEHGYGPRGNDFIAHVDVPDTVHQASALINTLLGDMTRTANPLFASAKR